jgi:hypothetical protein
MTTEMPPELRALLEQHVAAQQAGHVEPTPVPPPVVDTVPPPSAWPAPAQEDEKPPTPVVAAERESRLEQLAAQYDTVWEQHAELDARLTALKDAIKLELQTRHPDAEEVVLTSPFLSAPLRMKRGMHLSIKLTDLREKRPDVYAEFVRETPKAELRRARR